MFHAFNCGPCSMPLQYRLSAVKVQLESEALEELENQDYLIFTQTVIQMTLKILMWSKFDQDPSSNFIQEDPISNICVIKLTNRLTNGQPDKQDGHENNASLVKVTRIFRILKQTS